MKDLTWLDHWKGRTFECLMTGERLTIPDDVRPKQFMKFGECFIDMGDGYYMRYGGEFEEVE